MGGELLQAKSASWVCVQAGLWRLKFWRRASSLRDLGSKFNLCFLMWYLYQILKCRGEGSLVGPVWKALEDLVVLFEGDVADHEVVQQDAQTPHGEAARGIPSRQEPLWWGVHAGAWNKGTWHLAELPFVFVFVFCIWPFRGMFLVWLGLEKIFQYHFKLKWDVNPTQ